MSEKRRRHTPEQIIRKLREGERQLGAGAELSGVLKHLEITEATWYRGRNQYGGMKADEAKRLKELERENARLKKMVAEQALDRPGHAQGAEPGKLVSPERRRRAVTVLQSGSGLVNDGPAGWSGSTAPPNASRPWRPATSSRSCGNGCARSPRASRGGAGARRIGRCAAKDTS